MYLYTSAASATNFHYLTRITENFGWKFLIVLVLHILQERLCGLVPLEPQNPLAITCFPQNTQPQLYIMTGTDQ